MHPIGGYFELELRKGKHYHENAFRLNSARNCLAVILRERKWKKLYLPFYTCEVMLQPIDMFGVEYGFYHIDSSFRPIDIPDLTDHEAFVYTNYFGLNQGIVEELAEQYSEQLIVDNAQAFFAPRIAGVDTFYSPRKFFGVPDGGYLYSDIDFPLSYEIDHLSWMRMCHLCRRIDEGAESGFEEFRKAEEYLDNAPIRIMSRLTESILSNIDYGSVKEIRRRNYLIYQDELSSQNGLQLTLHEDDVPMCYPFFTPIEVRNKLLDKKVFIPYLWKSVRNWCPEGFEVDLSDRLLALPLDQRCSLRDIEEVISIIKHI